MFSIVICTLNPDPRLLRRSIASIGKLYEYTSLISEILLVDNNSCPPITEEMVRSLHPDLTGRLTIIREEKPGLAFARSRGFLSASGQWVICMDDDVELDRSFIASLKRCIDKYPNVGVWGPGFVQVEWQEGSDPLVCQYFAKEFCEWSQKSVEYGLQFPSPRCVPYGAGMVVQIGIGKQLAHQVITGQLTSTGRLENSFAACEDMQLNWFALSEGWAVGRDPELRINHLVSSKHAQVDCVARRSFGYAASYAPALREALPQYYNLIPRPAWKVLVILLMETLSTGLGRRGRRPLKTNIAPLLGDAFGKWIAAGVTPPLWSRYIARRWYHCHIQEHVDYISKTVQEKDKKSKLRV